ncbi:hypothetical protein QZH41_007766 [Actinostola sp. cb2023]|nr:hypothetical protein QZH41_007766 [Actinostola sp. cb2023]
MKEPEFSDSFDYLFKIVLIGDPGVGKTCLVQRFQSGTYVERQGSTIGVDFTMKTIRIDNKRIKLQVWDTAGQERFRTITQSYYRNANGVIIAYDITKKDTFKSVPRWTEDVEKYAPQNVIRILVGNKKDLRAEQEVTLEEAKTFADHFNIEQVLEVSAKDAINVDEAFIGLATALKTRYELGSQNSKHRRWRSFNGVKKCGQ